MKKIIVPILLICYLAVSTGIVVNLHYCMNRLTSAELFTGESKQCGKCGMNTDDSNGCCHDDIRIVKMDDDQKLTASVSFNLPAIEALVCEVSDFIVASFYNVPVTGHYQSHSPPLLSAQDIYLQNSVFRI
ncbi:MAG: hypothetical protein ABI675_22090 [Chitinophagaceae bacterium]